MKYLWKNQNQTPSQKSTKISFKKKYTLQQRIKKRQRLQVKYPKGKFIHVVLLGLDKLTSRDKAFMLIGVQKEFTVMHLLQYLRKSLSIDDKKGIFIQAGQKVTSMTLTLGQLYQKLEQEDGFIYIDVKSQNIFG